MTDETIRTTPVQSDKNVRVNWFNVNVPTVMSVAAAGIACFWFIADLKAKVDATEVYRVTRSAQTDKNFAELKAQVAPVAQATDNLSYRMGQNEGAIKAANERMDRFAENFVSTMEALRKDVANLTTEVRVLSNEIKNATPQRPNRAALDAMPRELAQ